MRGLTKLLRVLSDESKLRVLNLIQERECCVCEVMQAMDISQSKASRALSALYNVGLLKLRKEGRWALYSIDTEPEQKYVGNILKGIRSALINNKITRQDLQRLEKAERIRPSCLGNVCDDRPVAKSF
jgi:ArsR family transcriptional regulator, arsenate/arsenite/antimonite-responsive transcriptional repressor